MPAYDFRCKDCRHTFTLGYESYQAFEEATPSCLQCGSAHLSHLIRRVAVLTMRSRSARAASHMSAVFFIASPGAVCASAACLTSGPVPTLARATLLNAGS